MVIIDSMISGYKTDPRPDIATDQDQPLRKDAELNRRRILLAARSLFADQGIGMSFTDLAERAGCGVGTVYRRFPTKEMLLEALLEERVDELAELARVGVDSPDPWDGLSEFLEGVIDAMRRDRGLQDLLLCSSAGRSRQTEAQKAFMSTACLVWERAQRADALRADITIQDIFTIQIMLSAVIDATSDAQPELWRRYLALILRGLRADPSQPEPLPIESLDETQFDAVMRTLQPSSRRQTIDHDCQV